MGCFSRKKLKSRLVLAKQETWTNRLNSQVSEDFYSYLLKCFIIFNRACPASDPIWIYFDKKKKTGITRLLWTLPGSFYRHVAEHGPVRSEETEEAGAENVS